MTEQTTQPTDSSAKTQKKSTPRWAFLAIALIVATAVFAASYYVLVYSFLQKNSQKLTSARAELQAQVVNHHIGKLQARVNQLATSNSIRLLMSATNASLRAAAETQLKKSIPELVAYRLIDQGKAALDPNAEIPIRYTELDMIRRAEIGESVLPEAVKINQQWLLQVVTAIKDTDSKQIVGTILVSLKPDSLHQVLFVDGHVQLQQQYNKETPKIVLENTVEGSEYFATAKTNNAYWKIHYSPNVSYLTSQLRESWRLLACIAIALATALVVYLGALILAPIIAKKNSKHKQHQAKLAENDLLDIEVAQTDAGILDMQQASSQPLPTLDSDFASPEEFAQAKSDIELAESSIAIPNTIFRDYDIRGIAGKEISEPLTELIGRAIGSEALDRGETQLVVGRDGRNSSDTLSQKLIQGITSTGCSVVNLGLATTPMVYFACHSSQEMNSGVVVTASHNPAEYNGFKIVIGGETLFGEAIQKLKQRVKDQNFHQGNGGEQSSDIADDYITRIMEDIILDEYKVVVDAGNGVAGSIAPQLLEELGCKVIPLHCEIDGNFPNHPADPSVEANMADLIAKVKSEGADLGIAVDGDGDRLGLVTSSGRILWADEIMMLLAKDVVTRNPGCDILFDVKSSRHLGELISSYGGRPVMWKTGHSHMKTKLKQLGAPLGGEYSGHIFFNERWYGFDDGLYAAARLMEIMTLREQDLDSMAAAIPASVSTPELKLEIPETRKFELVQALSENGDFDDAKITDIDGIRADYPHGWGLVRASNTSPALTLRFEADSQEALSNIQDIFRREITKIDADTALPF